MLIPTDDTAIRRTLDQWLEKQDVRPILIGEFEDYAMLREFARGGHGFAPVPAVMEDAFRREFDFARIGRAHGVKAEYFAISVERKIKHPAVMADDEQCAGDLCAGETRQQSHHSRRFWS